MMYIYLNIKIRNFCRKEKKMVIKEQNLEVKIVTRKGGAKRPNSVLANKQNDRFTPVRLSFALCFYFNAFE